MRLLPPTPSRTSWSRGALLLTALLLALVFVPVGLGGVHLVAAQAGAIFVATDGSDTAGDGTSSNPWQTIQKAADAVAPGDTVLVRPGTYPDAVEMYDVAGTADAPVTFKADGADVVIDASDADVERDAVRIGTSSYVV